MATETTIRKVMAKLLKAYPSRQYSADELVELSEIWIAVLSDVPDAALENVAFEYMRGDAQFAPAPGQLRTRAMALMGATTENKAEEAWVLVKEQILCHDPITDPLAQKAMERAGGVEAFRNSDTEFEFKWKRDFVRHYGIVLESQTAGLALPAGDAGKLIEATANGMRGDNGRKQLNPA